MFWQKLEFLSFSDKSRLAIGINDESCSRLINNESLELIHWKLYDSSARHISILITQVWYSNKKEVKIKWFYWTMSKDTKNTITNKLQKSLNRNLMIICFVGTLSFNNMGRIHRSDKIPQIHRSLRNKSLGRKILSLGWCKSVGFGGTHWRDLCPGLVHQSHHRRSSSNPCRHLQLELILQGHHHHGRSNSNP